MFTFHACLVVISLFVYNLHNNVDLFSIIVFLHIFDVLFNI